MRRKTWLAVGLLAVAVAGCGKKSGGSGGGAPTPAPEQNKEGELESGSFFVIQAQELEDIDSRIRTNLNITAAWSASLSVNNKLEQTVDRKPIGDVISLLKDKKFKTADKVNFQLTARNAAVDTEILATNDKNLVKDDAHLNKIFEGECKDITSTVYKYGDYDKDEKGNSIVRIRLCDFKNIFFRPDVEITAQTLKYEKKTKSYECAVKNSMWYDHFFFAFNTLQRCTYGYKMIDGEQAPSLHHRAGEEISESSKVKPHLKMMHLFLDELKGLQRSSETLDEIFEARGACHTLHINGSLAQENGSNTFRVTLKYNAQGEWVLDPYVSKAKLIQFKNAMGNQPYYLNFICDWYHQPEESVVKISTR